MFNPFHLFNFHNETCIYKITLKLNLYIYYNILWYIDIIYVVCFIIVNFNIIHAILKKFFIIY